MVMLNVFEFQTAASGAICPSEPVPRMIEVELMGCGSPDTAVIFTTCDGRSKFDEHPDPENTRMVYYFTNSDSGNCEETIDTLVGRFKIQFVKITDDFNINDRSSWEYRKVPSVRLMFDHQANTNVTVYVYKNRGESCAVNGTDRLDNAVDQNAESLRFSDIDGIEEIVIEIDQGECYIEELSLYDEFQGFAGMYVVPVPGLVLLIDTSGSMNWNYLGQSGVPQEESRLALVKAAAKPFLELMKNHVDAGEAYKVWIANFPVQPWPDELPDPWQDLCEAETGTLFDMITIDDAITKVDELNAKGATPLIAGINEAIKACGTALPRVIVLLSDGYHNCPTQVEASGPEVADLLALLKDKSIRVYTIGFARPVDVDSAILTQLASVSGFNPNSPCVETSGMFYSVTDDEPTSAWAPGPALQAVFKEILAEVLGLQLVDDPLDTVSNEKSVETEIYLCEHDKSVSFYVGWESATEDRLTIQVVSSDNQLVEASEPGVRLSRGVGYSILTVGNEFLNRDGKIDEQPWLLKIEASGFEDGESEKIQYSVLVDSDLKLETEIVSPELATGEDLTLQALVTEDGKPMTGLKDVTVSIKAPEDSLGNWYAGTIVSEKDLRSVDLKRGVESPSALQRKAIFMSDTLKNPPPRTIKGPSIQLRESKHQVDSKTKNTFYTRSFSSTKKEGTYSFHFKLSGTTDKGIKFTREAKVNRNLRAIFSPEHSDIKHIPVSITKDLQKIRVVLTPRDKHGNHLGPGYGSAIHLTPSIGQLVGTMNDDLSGSYSQIIEVPAGVVSDARLKVRIGKTATSVGIKPSIDGLRSLFNRFTWLQWVIIAILIIYIGYLGMQP